jgi:hypothetical protein
MDRGQQPAPCNLVSRSANLTKPGVRTRSSVRFETGDRLTQKENGISQQSRREMSRKPAALSASKMAPIIAAAAMN